MAYQLTFVAPTPLTRVLGKPYKTSKATSSVRPRLDTGRSVARPTPKAVLDTPASNTYLQRQAELVVRDFLTRRAITTVLYYMQELGDGPSHNWLNAFQGFSGRVAGQMFKNGDGFLNDMLVAEKIHGVLKVGHPTGRFSRSFPFTIEPRHIARRIFDVRVHLASEWAQDLCCVPNENLEIQRLSFERQVAKSEAELDSKRNLIFDSDPFAHDQTPLRFQNYVGLKTLLTQHAVARLLPFLRDQGSNHDYMFLLQFINRYGAIADGDAFVRTLMEKAPEPRTNPSFTVLPRAIAVQLMNLRAALANEWVSVMKFVPEEYNLMKIGMLEKSMEAMHEPTPEDL